MKKLAAARRRGRIVPGAVRSGLAHMVNKHYVKARPISPHMILYVITDHATVDAGRSHPRSANGCETPWSIQAAG